MPDPLGYATFPGISQIVAASYTATHGRAPSAALVTIAPQADLPALNGDLVFRFGNISVPIRGCRVDTASFERNASGLIWRLRILDRRWKWDEFGEIGGRYNLRKTNYQLDTDTEKTPTELAKLCLQAMGEGTGGAIAFPNDARPLVEWNPANPAAALEELAEMFSCRVVWNPITNLVSVLRQGVGAMLPNLPAVADYQEVFDPPEVPDSLKVVCAPTRFQATFRLKAVGRDMDGSIKLIDDLSYKPAAGWNRSDPWWFADLNNDPGELAKNQQTVTKQKLALQTVWRWYMIDRFADDKLVLPGFGDIKDIKRCLPIEAEQARSVFRDDGTLENMPPIIQGLFFVSAREADEHRYRGFHPGENSTDAETAYWGPFSIDRERGIVMFQEPIYRLEAGDTPGYSEAELYLTCAFSVADPKTRANWRHTKELPLGEKSGTGPRLLLHDELTRIVIFNYDLNKGLNKGVDKACRKLDADLAKACDYYLNSAKLKYQIKDSQDVTYNGLVPIGLDGAICQVEWRCESGKGCTTHASRNTESSRVAPPYEAAKFWVDWKVEKARAAREGQHHREREAKRIFIT